MDQDDKTRAFVQDRMPPDQRAAFQAEIDASPELAAEVAMLQAARAEFAAEPAPDAAAAWARLEPALDRGRPSAANVNARPRRALLQAAMVAVISIGLWQALVVPRLGPSSAPGFTAASVPDASVALQIGFADTATAGEIAATLYDLGGVITDGPSALGLYRVEFPDAPSRDAAKETLAARPDLVTDLREN